LTSRWGAATACSNIQKAGSHPRRAIIDPELWQIVQDKLAADRIEIRINRAKIVAALQAGEGRQRPDLDPVVLSIETKLRRAGKGKRLVIENGAAAEVNAGLAAMIAKAFALRNQLLSESDDSIEPLSGRLGMNVRLSYLAPDITRAPRGPSADRADANPALATEQGRLERASAVSSASVHSGVRRCLDASEGESCFMTLVKPG